MNDTIEVQRLEKDMDEFGNESVIAMQRNIHCVRSVWNKVSTELWMKYTIDYH